MCIFMYQMGDEEGMALFFPLVRVIIFGWVTKSCSPSSVRVRAATHESKQTYKNDGKKDTCGV